MVARYAVQNDYNEIKQIVVNHKDLILDTILIRNVFDKAVDSKHIVVAVHGGAVVAFIFFYKHKTDNLTVTLYDIASMHQGAGSFLLRYWEDEMLQRYGRRLIKLKCSVLNEANAFYLKHGYTVNSTEVRWNKRKHRDSVYNIYMKRLIALR